MGDFNDYLKTLEDGIKNLAEKMLKEFTKEALKDSKKFLKKTEEDLKRWTRLLASGELTLDDFEWLVIGKKDLAELYLLKRKGLSLVRIDRFRNSLIDLIIDTALDLFL
jgi:hypothetical protein